MIIKVMAVGPIQANCYILGCPASGEALVIDPGEDADRIQTQLSRLSLKPVLYFLTHGHLDHVGAATTLKESLGGMIMIHKEDLFLYESIVEQGQQFGLPASEPAPPDDYFKDGETVTWGECRGTVIHTPGHSPGGVCLHIDKSFVARGMETDAAGDATDWVITGDTLFNGSIGRTDLPGGSYEIIMTSIKEKLLPMPDDTVIAPGHGPLSTIGQEKKINPFVRELY
jgi:hydroxyacylglutathione hydrolase